MKKNRYIKYSVYIVFIIIFLILWEHSAGNSNKVRLMVSAPSLITDYFQENCSDLLKAMGITFYESIMGLLLAITFSFCVMIVCFYIPFIMDYVLPIMVSSQVVPLITLAPLFIIVFGIGYLSKILMSTLICFFPIFVNFANGVKLIPKNIHEMLFIYNTSKTKTIFQVYFPLSTPHIITGLKVAATLSVIGAIVAEFSGAEFGLGRNLYISALRLEPEMMMSSLVLSALLGGTLFGIIVFIEKLIGKWYLTNNNQ